MGVSITTDLHVLVVATRRTEDGMKRTLPRLVRGFFMYGGFHARIAHRPTSHQSSSPINAVSRLCQRHVQDNDVRSDHGRYGNVLPDGSGVER